LSVAETETESSIVKPKKVEFNQSEGGRREESGDSCACAKLSKEEEEEEEEEEDERKLWIQGAGITITITDGWYIGKREGVDGSALDLGS